MIKIDFSGRFRIMYEELVEKEIDLKQVIFHRIELFRKNPQDTRLANHALTKHLKGNYAFSIDDDVRIVYEWKGKNNVRFLAIGIHRKVYFRKQN